MNLSIIILKKFKPTSAMGFSVRKYFVSLIFREGRYQIIAKCLFFFTNIWSINKLKFNLVKLYKKI